MLRSEKTISHKFPIITLPWRKAMICTKDTCSAELKVDTKVPEEKLDGAFIKRLYRGRRKKTKSSPGK